LGYHSIKRDENRFEPVEQPSFLSAGRSVGGSMLSGATGTDPRQGSTDPPFEQVCLKLSMRVVANTLTTSH
jgi:hypothetical protein